MGKKRERNPSRERLSPTRTVAHLTDDFVDTLGIPALPDHPPERLAGAIRERTEALLFHLEQACTKEYAHPFEVRLVRDAHRIVLAAFELGVTDAEVSYARFRRLVEALDYERVDVGFRKRRR
jgi:hypothetical protein